MKCSWLAVGLVAGLSLMAVTQGAAAPSGARGQSQIARGEHLVKAIGQCGECHTPFNDHGEYVIDKWLQGKKLEFAPPAYKMNRADAEAVVVYLRSLK